MTKTCKLHSLHLFNDICTESTSELRANDTLAVGYIYDVHIVSNHSRIDVCSFRRFRTMNQEIAH